MVELCITASPVFVVSGNSYLMFSNNDDNVSGRAVHMSNNIDFIFGGNFIILFNSSAAISGEANFSTASCNIIFQENTSVTFSSCIS